MTNKELAEEFDIFYNNISSNQAPGLDYYEKSIFLTRAQDDIIKAYLSPRGNKNMQGYDDSRLRQIDFSKITVTVEWHQFQQAEFDTRPNSCSVYLNHDMLIPLNEKLIVYRNSKEKELQVVPISYDEYSRLMSKPFKRPSKNEAWRLITDSDKMDLIIGPGDELVEFTIRYVRKPKPIILFDLDPGYTIEGLGTAQECELDSVLHHELVQRAVELAKAAYTGDLQNQLVLGQASQTNIGVVAQS